ncbi:7-carboxy-7-deazaguanine synthase QueE [Ectothiorhodospiraceae bacterium BW-2]|nr:7-carboxy-7-deazaguanine synthase QueE [Ectothiorhodospiraceae bacterium BW-2]
MLRLTELFVSLQGEGNGAGWPTVFVRLTGCPLRCHYCDSSYAFSGGQGVTVAEVVERVSCTEVTRVCVTGGEPLSQKETPQLLTALLDRGLQVSLETSGALSIAGLDRRLEIVMDVKTPGSGEVERTLERNLALLQGGDQLKFVLCGRRDYLWAKAWLAEHDLLPQLTVLFSPVWGELSPSELAEWILADNLSVKLQLQLHKLLWGEVPGR